MKRALITGGAGFIGSYLTEMLLDEGMEVICVDNFITGSPDNIAHIDSDRLTFLERDVSKGLSDITESLDYVLHFASPASPIDYMKYPVETLLVGSAGTHAALDLAVENNAVFMLASTSEVYGDPLSHPQQESYWGNVNPIGPRSCYDEAKRYAEAAVMAYHRKHELDIRIVRIFNTYGPRMQIEDGRAVTNFICQALRGDDITVFGDGSQTRSFTFVSDLAKGIISLLFSDETAPVNIGNPREMTVKELAETVLKLTDSSSKIVHMPPLEDDPMVRRPDITRANSLLGWNPAIELEEGLPTTIDYYRKELKINR